jgi:hypothetical protein
MNKTDFYAKYGDVKVKFSEYYKYTFTYKAILPNGQILTCCYGGAADEIYRHEVTDKAEETINILQPYSGAVYKDGVEVESFYEDLL